MLTLVSFLSGFVRRLPVLVIALALLLTGVLGYFIQFQVLAEGNEGFAPEAPELDAFGEIGDLFGDDSSGQVLQIILTAPEGESMISPEGREVADLVTAAIEDAEIADRLQDTAGQPPIVSPFSALDGAGAFNRVVVAVASDDRPGSEAQPIADHSNHRVSLG